MRLLQANAAGSPRPGYSTSGSAAWPRADPATPAACSGPAAHAPRNAGLRAGVVLVADDGHVGRLDREFFVGEQHAGQGTIISAEALAR